jgi:hypothetical protein
MKMDCAVRLAILKHTHILPAPTRMQVRQALAQLFYKAFFFQYPQC